MTRRQVLRLLGVTAAALVEDPERRLWTPGQRKIFIPPAPAIGRPTIADILGDGRWHYIAMDGSGRIWSLEGGNVPPVQVGHPFLAKGTRRISLL